MISDPDLVLYTCIAHQHSSESSTILAEFNSSDSSLQEFAHQCLNLVPPHHIIFTQTFHNRSYTFLINNGFVFFGIFDSKLAKSDQIRFLGRLKETIDHLIKGKSKFKFSSYSLQGELHPIFPKLMSKSIDFDDLHLISNGVDHNSSNNNKKGLSLSMLSSSKIGKGLKKKKLSGDSLTNSREALVDDKADFLSHNDYDYDDNEIKSREINHQNGNYLMDGIGSNVGRHKAKKIWRRHVWIVLLMDLAVCLILFGIWLFVCHGFQCVER
ncbi:phytolongin Phyl2.2 [Amaranthus tricolor]|uniref:phytolongin Phyl2.2 n=1 Tax=Amaranthus tricolor TaxID=29722 RepID=UPI00259111C2|nr:phytolongin Phyl2.2 [Amaranthus tricolor]